MSANICNDLKAFDAFVTANFSNSQHATLEDALREFRAQQQWQPRTKLGALLKELRSQFIAEGGRLLSPSEIAAEVHERRGDSFSDR
jgi:hypothetical protein